MSKNLEGQLQLSILKYLKFSGYVAGKTKTMGVKAGNIYRKDPYTFTGFPDITVFTPELVFIECKSPTGKQSKAQIEFEALCDRAGVKYILARRMEDVTEEL